MFGIGFQEMLIILVVALIFFGPKRLPDLAKSLGKGIAEFKKASEEVRKGVEDAVKEESAEEAPTPPEDLSAYGKAPGSAPAPEEPAPVGGTPPVDAAEDAAPSADASAAAEDVAQETATGGTPAPPPRQG
ncbi:MAG: twin arginine-targeting protein translocase TatB [Deltaproteobacteria bacterium CG2_30_66_27]|nr:MAG: twin arginine-targeting protein translocase TatB [Deltaproteobacteria bacterium CG2_30_66_27]PJB32807.1 MAG: twin-arginine translocase subunit TatB [Deltaproteobacteria bacterium CG_4_9_14_3_um_filter_65_9]